MLQAFHVPAINDILKFTIVILLRRWIKLWMDSSCASIRIIEIIWVLLIAAGLMEIIIDIWWKLEIWFKWSLKVLTRIETLFNMLIWIPALSNNNWFQTLIAVVQAIVILVLYIILVIHSNFIVRILLLLFIIFKLALDSTLWSLVVLAIILIHRLFKLFYFYILFKYL